MIPAAIVTDIEGTTSSIAFVHDILFPYSRTRLGDYVREHPHEVASILDAVRAETGEALDQEGCIARLLQWHDADRKIGPLKSLQGLIWADGYVQQHFTGHVYADAATVLRRWHRAGIRLYVYSSGSIAAQKLLFSFSDHGDLESLFSGHFDTSIGGKREAASYRAIAAALALPSANILFLSDTPEELDAAREAGLSVTLLARDGVPVDHAGYPVAMSFSDIAQVDSLT